MTDLHASLVTLIARVRTEITHGPHCPQPTQIDFACSCDWQARVESELARRWAASIEAGIDAAVFEIHEGDASGYRGMPECVALALAAARRAPAP